MRHRASRRVVGVGLTAVAAFAVAACGTDPAATSDPAGGETISLPTVGEPDDADSTSQPTLREAADAAADAIETAPAATSGRPASPDAGAAVEPAAPTLELQTLDQAAIWPAADVVFATPEEAAADFVSGVLIGEGDPLLGEFRAGDSRSGEIAVLFAGETGDLDPPQEKGVLLLRQIGPTDGWYVIAALSDGVVIDTPSASDEVPAGVITVAGEGRGFEGTLVVSAFPPGDDSAPLDLQIGAGGAMADLEPFSVELDVSGAAAGDVVVVLVRGDTGLGNDPSTFAAVPVVITSPAPVTIPPTR